MTMREIRDLVLSTRDLSDYVEARFEDARASLQRAIDETRLEAAAYFVFSATAVPLDPDRIAIDAYRGLERPSELKRAYGVIGSEEVTVEALFPVYGITWRPMMRGAVGLVDRELAVEIHNNGD